MRCTRLYRDLLAQGLFSNTWLIRYDYTLHCAGVQYVMTGRVMLHTVYTYSHAYSSWLNLCYKNITYLINIANLLTRSTEQGEYNMAYLETTCLVLQIHLACFVVYNHNKTIIKH